MFLRLLQQVFRDGLASLIPKNLFICGKKDASIEIFDGVLERN